MHHKRSEAESCQQQPGLFQHGWGLFRGGLVLDIQLEGMSGLELRKRLSAGKDGTPVVFITAHDDPEVCAQVEASGCAGYFRKTDSGTDVLAAIRRATGLEHSDSGRKRETL